MKAIYKRELLSYFTTPLGYVFCAVFLAITGFIFSTQTLQNAVAGSAISISTYFVLMIFILAILIPLLTMKSLSEDKKLKTEQLLLTSAVSLPGMVYAKFFAAYTVFASAVLVSCFNFTVLSLYGEPNYAILFGYVISVLLVGAAFTAVGIFVSSLTENQIVAACGTVVILAAMVAISFFNSYIDSAFVRTILSWISVYSRFGNFTYGLFDFAALLYYISVCFVFLFLTVRVYEKRRWE